MAVLDPVPLLRLGVIAALGGGTSLESAELLAAWLTGGRPCLLLIGLLDADDDSWAVLAGLRRSPQVRTVAMLATCTEVLAARAMRTGAVHVLPRNADPDELRRVVHEARRGVVSVPLATLRTAMALRRAGPTAAASPSEEELDWLRALGRGDTVSAIAQARHLSERVLYRRLNLLYGKLGVAGRTQALILGRDEGWL